MTNTQDIVSITGDMDRGITTTHDLRKTAFAVVQMIYRGRYVPPNFQQLEIECEIYKAGDILSVHTVCPKCKHAQWIDGRNKKVEYSGGQLHVEAFKCSWEMGGEDDHADFGFGLCGLTLEYAGKVVREA